MIPPRLSVTEIIATAMPVPPDAVAEGDLRLGHLDEGFCRCIVPTSPGATFVAWPDMTLGFALLWPDEDEADRSSRLVEAYREARESLERLALDFFTVFNPERPH